MAHRQFHPGRKMIRFKFLRTLKQVQYMQMKLWTHSTIFVKEK